MRKITILVLAMLLMVGTAFALDGLQIGAGLRFNDFDAPRDAPATNDLDPDGYIFLEVNYEYRFGDIRITADVVLPIHLDEDYDGEIEIRFERAQYFNDDLLSFITGMEANIPLNGRNPLAFSITPGFQLRPTFGFGNIYFRADIPFNFVGGRYETDEDGKYVLDPAGNHIVDRGFELDNAGLNFTFSVNRLRGMGIGREDTWGFELGLRNDLSIGDEFLQNMTLTPYFAHEWFYAEIEIGLPLMKDGFDIHGMAITPEAEVFLPWVDGLSVWLNMPISNIGVDWDDATNEGKAKLKHDDPVIGLGFGVRFAF